MKINRAKQLLKDATLALINGERVCVYNERGIKTLLSLLQDDPQLLENATVADKIVGKAAAYLMVKGGVKEVYAETISERAIEVFRLYQIPVTFGVRTLQIVNRSGTGPCPMESTVEDIDDIELAFEALKQKVKALNG